MTITSFAPQLVVITSKQRPRKLTIHGNDGEDHTFLLKGHEDLRQDERVMQVTSLNFSQALFCSWQLFANRICFVVRQNFKLRFCCLSSLVW